jgi:sugar/nucleoside kinase (ribokinase family)
MSDDFLEETRKFLKSKARELNVVVMPDFFMDRLISLDCSEKDFCKNLKNVIRKKGGSIDQVKQADIRGGNAVNTASALAALDVNVTPIICTNDLGARLLRFHLKSPKLQFSRVKTLDEPSMTTALEFKARSGRINVMLRDVGSLASFGPNNLNNADFEAIGNADYVCVFNWAGTKRFGTELAEAVFSHVKRNRKGKTYLDTADPTPNAEKIPELVRRILKSQRVDILSVNENEAICYASMLSDEVKELKKRLGFEELAREAARILAARLSARVDLHATSFSATFTRNRETVVPAFRVPVLRATGAGDAWNAGNILADANKLSPECRLTLANAVAAYYISSPHGTHPTRKQLAEFCRKTEQRMKP